MSIRSPYPDVEVPEIALHGFVREQADRRSAAVPLMGPADPGTVVPLMGPADPGTVLPLMGPADSGTATHVMSPRR
jgi:hypothetical protein